MRGDRSEPRRIGRAERARRRPCRRRVVWTGLTLTFVTRLLPAARTLARSALEDAPSDLSRRTSNEHFAKPRTSFTPSPRAAGGSLDPDTVVLASCAAAELFGSPSFHRTCGRGGRTGLACRGHGCGRGRRLRRTHAQSLQDPSRPGRGPEQRDLRPVTVSQRRSPRTPRRPYALSLRRGDYGVSAVDEAGWPPMMRTAGMTCSVSSLAVKESEIRGDR